MTKIETNPDVADAVNTTPEELCQFITGLLEDKKAKDIVVINLKGKTNISDYMIICSGGSNRQVGSIAEHVVVELKKAGHQPRVEGFPQCDWVLVDAWDVIVHVFRPEARSYYNLEKMWGEFPEPNE